MSAFGKVSFTENTEVANETVVEETNNNSVVEEQVSKFDNSYATNEKLQDLYSDFDKISIDQNVIQSLTQVTTNVVSKKVPFRVVLAMTTTMIVTVLLAFLCIYNIFVINNMGTSINCLQEEVIEYEYDYVQAERLYNDLTSVDGIQSELNAMGYGEIASSNIVAVSVPDKTEVIELQGETNWFDSLCNFLSQIFG